MKVSLEPMETKLISGGINQRHAKVVALIVCSPALEQHERGWVIPIEQLGPLLPVMAQPRSKRTEEKRREVLRSLILESVIKIELEGSGFQSFPIFNSIEMAQDSSFLSIVFSASFIEWSGLGSRPTSPLAH